MENTNAYKFFKNTEFNLNNINFEEVKKDLKKEISELEILKNFETMKKLATSCTEEQFNSYIEENEIPPLKLSNDELNVLKGGVLPLILIAGAAYGTYKYLTY